MMNSTWWGARLTWPLAMALLTGCQEGIVLDIRVLGRPAEATGLIATAALNRTPALGAGKSVNQTPDRFRIQLEDALQGQLQLHLSAQTAKGCEIAAGDGAVELTGPGTYLLEISLRPQQGCTLEVELVGPGTGRVTSLPAGIDCGAQCSQAFGRNQVVNLSVNTPDLFGGWFTSPDAAGCVGRVGCAIAIASAVTRVRANFIRADSCTASGWCVEEDLPPDGRQNHLYSVWGSGRDDVWAVGDTGTILHGDGLLWRGVAAGTRRALRGVWGSRASDVWAVGETGAVLHWNGLVWSQISVPTRAWLNGVWGASRSDVWAVGDSGTALHWDGAAWSAVDVGVAQSLRGIWGSGPQDVWAVGDSGAIVHWNGAAWTPVTAGATGSHLYSVWGTGADNIWMVGDGGTILRRTGSGTLVQVSSGTQAGLHTVWGTNPTQTWAVGNGGVMLLWNGSAWNSVISQKSPVLLAGIWGSGPQDVWAVGQQLVILRYRP